MNFTIRKATPSDFSTIQKLNAALFQSDRANDDALDRDWPYSIRGVEYYRESLQNPDKIVLLAEDGTGRPVGYVIGCSRNKFSYRRVKTGELENMYVLPSKRRQGVGRALVEKLSQWLGEKGIDRVYVSAYVRNQNALAFYRSVGFFDWEMGMEMKLERR